jgi:hypothetical protein
MSILGTSHAGYAYMGLVPDLYTEEKTLPTLLP